MSVVSVIIPYFKKKKFISNALKSVLNQTYQKFEIIIVYDDPNKDELRYIQKLAEQDKRIKVIKNEINLGAGPSRNKAIKKSKGKYIAFLDADDEWLKEKLSIQIKLMKKKKLKASHTSYFVINSMNEVKEVRNATFVNYNSLLYSCDIGLSTVILEKNIFKENIQFANTKTKEDYILWLTISKLNINFFPIQKKLTKWRKTNNSLSSSFLQKLVDGYKVYFYFMKFGFFKSIYHLVMLCLNFLKKKIKSKMN